MKSIKACAAVALLVASMVFGHGSARGQSGLGSLNVLVGIPMGDFKSNIDKNGYGLAVNVGLAPVSSFFMIGVEAGFMTYGTERRTERFSSTIPDVMVDVETSNNFALAHLFLRLQPNQGFLRPYLEGSGGINYLYTQTEIQNRRGGEEVASSNNKDDIAFSYGAGGGMLLRVHESDNPEGSGIAEVLVDLRVRYIKGGEAEYLKQGSIRRENGQVRYDVLKSKTDIVTVQFGIAVRF
jgi:opacity protein-like surface antigen